MTESTDNSTVVLSAVQRKLLRMHRKNVLVDLANDKWFPTSDEQELKKTANYLKALKAKRKKALMLLANRAYLSVKNRSLPKNELGSSCMKHWKKQVVLLSDLVNPSPKKVTERGFNRCLFETSMCQNNDTLNFKVPEPRLPCYRLRDL